MTAQMWDGADTAWWGLLAAAVVVALGASAVAFWALARCALWRGRCEDRDETIAGYEEALDDARLTMINRRHPAAMVHSWGHTRQHRQPERSWWPGTQGPLPFTYGHQAEPLDPCLIAPPAEADLHAWLTEPQHQTWPILDTEGLLIERVLTALEAGTQELQVVPPRELEVVPQ